MLQVIDNQWKDHLLSMDELKQGIGNRAHGQKDPLVEYKKESYELFTAMMDRIEDETVRYLYFLQVTHERRPVLPFPDERRGGRRRKNGRSRRSGASAPTPRRAAAPGRQEHHGGLHAQYPAQEGKGTGRTCNSWAATASSAPKTGEWRARRWAATIHAPAAAARSTRSATGRRGAHWGRRRVRSLAREHLHQHRGDGLRGLRRATPSLRTRRWRSTARIRSSATWPRFPIRRRRFFHPRSASARPAVQ